MNIAERIDYLVKELAYDNGKLFSEKVGIPITSVSKWRHGARIPRRDVLEKILAAYPEVRREWLFEGKGAPLLKKRRVEMSADTYMAIEKRLDGLERQIEDLLRMMREIAEK